MNHKSINYCIQQVVFSEKWSQTFFQRHFIIGILKLLWLIY